MEYISISLERLSLGKNLPNFAFLGVRRSANRGVSSRKLINIDTDSFTETI